MSCIPKKNGRKNVESKLWHTSLPFFWLCGCMKLNIMMENLIVKIWFSLFYIYKYDPNGIVYEFVERIHYTFFYYLNIALSVCVYIWGTEDENFSMHHTIRHIYKAPPACSVSFCFMFQKMIIQRKITKKPFVWTFFLEP